MEKQKMYPLETQILVVDDSLTARDMLRSALKALGYNKIMTAKNGAEALVVVTAAKKAGNPVEVVLSDIKMPELDGIGFLEAVRNTPAVAFTPFIMVTGEGSQDMVLRAVKLKIDCFLLKPYTSAVLRTALKKSWAQRTSQLISAPS